MTGFCGVLGLDGAPADGALLDRMLARIAGPAATERGRWIGGPAALGGTGGARPLVSPETGCAILLDGRIDDREGLLPAPGSAPDAEVLLRAFEIRGEDALAPLAGDFALAWWDGKRRRMLLARGPLGIRRLFYARTPERLLFATDLRAPLEDPRVPRGMNEGVVAEALAGRLASAEETLHAGVRRLLPGHALAAGPEGVRLFRWWTIPEEERADLVGAAAAEALREAVDRAVRARLRGAEKVGVLLSGGVDSGTVAASARAAGAPGLAAYTQVFPGRPFDEGAGASRTAGHLGIPAHREPFAVPDPEDYDREAALHGVPPVHPVAMSGARLHGIAAAGGTRVLLTGHGGDEWPAGSHEALADHLRRGRLGRAVGAARGAAGSGEPRAAVSLLLRYGVRPLVPWPLKRLKRALLPPGLEAPWIRAEFARRVELADRLLPAFAGPARGSRERAAVLRAVGLGFWQEAWEAGHRTSLASGVEERHPLMDRRVVELCLSLPPEERWSGTTTKVALRRAAAGRIPEEARTSEDKPHAGPAIAESVLALADAGLLRFPSLVEAGMVDGSVLEGMVPDLRRSLAAGGDGYLPPLWGLWQCFAVERWVRMCAMG